jgi:hypothetical protein
MNLVRYQYVNVKRRKNPVVVAYSATENNGKIQIVIGASFCNSKDRFNRPTGRSIAEQRLNSSKPVIITGEMDTEMSFSKTVCAMIRNYIKDHSYDVMQAFCQKKS